MTTVHTQTELDAAIAAKAREIIIDSPAGVWLRLTSSGSSSVEARGSSSVEARGSSRVVAWDSSSVVAWDSSSVEARGSSRVEAGGSSSVEARGSSSVEAWGSSRVVAWDSSSVVAWDSSSVVAWGSSRVEAWGSSRVEASKYVAVHLRSQHVRLTGDGHLIDLTALNLADTATWCEYHGVKISRGSAVLYKAVDDNLRSGRGFEYPLGKTVSDPNWQPGDFCGSGLHLSPSPSCARDYFPEASRFLECRVKLADLSPITGGGAAKAKARAVRVVREVDLHGDPVGVAS